MRRITAVVTEEARGRVPVASQTGLPIIIYRVVPWTYVAPYLLARIIKDVPGSSG